MPAPQRLFVYGTLRQGLGHPMHRLLQEHATFVGRARFQGKLFDLGRYPGAVPSDDPSDVVEGELYELTAPEQALPALDEYEGCGPTARPPTEFRRVWATVQLEGGESVGAWVYIYNRPTKGKRLIPGGDYVRYRSQGGR